MPTVFKTIKIKRYSNVVNEYPASAAIIPGALVELISTGKVRNHATSGGYVAPMIALEDELQGRGINDNYAADEPVQVWSANHGDEAYLLLRDEETIVIGDLLQSDGLGKVMKRTSTNTVVGIALEAKDLSTFPEGSESSARGAYYNPRIRVSIQ